MPIALVMLVDPTMSPEGVINARSELGAGDILVLVEAGLWSGTLARATAIQLMTDCQTCVLRASLRLDDPATIGQALDLVPNADRIVLVARNCMLTSGGLDRLVDEADADIVFADEINSQPLYKPWWSIDLALEQNLIGACASFSRKMLEKIPHVPLTTPHDVALHCVAQAPSVAHIPELLARRIGCWQQMPGSAAVAAAVAVLATAELVPTVIPSKASPGRSRVRWCPVSSCTIYFIIPTRDRADLLEACVEGLLSRTAHPVHEIIIADNESRETATHDLLSRLSDDDRVKILQIPGAFNYSRINNIAAAAATGTVMILMNNDIEVMDPSWLDEMAGHALRPDVGAVGAKLLYPDGIIQHAGVVLGVGSFGGGPGIAGHFGLGRPADDPGYAGQFVTTREVSAVTGACIALRREVYQRVGGLDEQNLPVALNDIDLCLRIRALGLRVVWTPFAILYHRESASRGPDQDPVNADRFTRECRYMRDRWGVILDKDQFYNLNFSRFDHSFQPALP